MSVVENLTRDREFDTDPSELERLPRVLQAQKAASRQLPYPSLEQRREWLDRAIGVLADNKAALEETISEDFGNRSREQTGLIDLMSSIGGLKYCRKHVAKWMKPERRGTMFPFNLLGGRSYVFYQPLGVVGVVVPWNAPLALTFLPLSNVLAAGNRCMIKLPEQIPNTSALIRKMIESVYSESEVACFEGGVAMGQAFTSQPFDHLLFTGGANVARHVVANTAPNLTPVTLELGGKAAVLMGTDAKLEDAIPSAISGKLMNGGQVCMGVDHVLVHESRKEDAARIATEALKALYPTIAGNPDFTTLISQASFRRVKGLVDNAAVLGAEIIQPEAELAQTIPEQKPFCYPPTLVVGPPEKADIMQQEIFGPVLPIVTYKTIDDAIAYINRRERALALYYFGPHKSEQRKVLANTWSGGVTINEVMMHIMMPDLPGGGVGESGTGRYVGVHGFKTFSNAKAVFENGWFNMNKFFRPPYGGFIRKMIASGVKK